ncbi:MAG: DUF1553 domain-containing protein [Reichenbachiella sp.]|uniref:DUF1553 domain-containing protein n=1 Tax=Reichenbachiella sp. TaxID=2184521 RepID=UPI0032659A5C
MIKRIKKTWVISGLVAISIGLHSCSTTPPSIAISGNNELPDVVDFNFHIKPILSDRCFACHGPDKGSRLSGLRLDTPEGAFEAIGEDKDRYAIVPNHPDSSEVVKRIHHPDPKEVMPPPESNLTLSNYEKKLITKWIEQGAQWKKHWAFIPPVKNNEPQVKSKNWLKTPIDAFVLRKLEEVGLEPEAPASKEQLLRRVTFDLTGLPPSLEEIDEFMSDQSPNAFEKVVDRLLSSSAYGERMANEWLDVARYADTHGYQDDLKRNMWPWRDWVIKAFNDNMPYDNFIQWQIAGDLFENATYEQILATGFNRNHRVNQEGGIIDEEFRVEYVADRTNTTGTAFMGLTVSCARCHDHKYDPISTKEYYQMFAFFNNVPEKGRIEYDEPVKPLLKVPESKIQEVKTYLNKLIAEESKKIYQREKEVKKDWRQLEASWTANQNSNPNELPVNMLTYFGLDGIQSEVKRLTVDPKRPGSEESYFNEGIYSRALELDGSSYFELDNTFSPEYNQPFSIGFWLQTSTLTGDGAILAKMDKINKGNGMKGFDLFLDKNKLAVHLVNNWPFNAISVVTKQPIHPMKWTHVMVSYNGKGKAEGIKIYLDGELQSTTVETDNLSGSILSGNSMKIGSRGGNHALGKCKIDELSIYESVLNDTEVVQVHQYNPIQRTLASTPRSEQDDQKLFYHYLYKQDASYKKHTMNKYLGEQRKEFLNDPTANEVMVMEEMKEPRQAYILERGGYENHGEPVSPGTIQSVLEFPDHLPKNRLGLAQWLVSENNPLTARVAINRYWQLLFGMGIVPTPNDFGSQGELPTHPELLDWLAVDFMESGWDLKKAMKQIVMSATYQQASDITPEKLEIDPENLWLARGSRFRLSSEMLRDHALAISGLLVNQIGGPSVKPYQPAGLWAEVTSGRGLASYIEGMGNDLYRRSLYTYWKRTVPPPSMMIFDASERNDCTVKRQSTSTPLQALVLLNDPQFVEASRVLAERIILEGGEGFENRVQMAFKLATSRRAEKEELEILKEMYEQQQAGFELHPEEAGQLLSIGRRKPDQTINPVELASMTVITNTILNLTETITRG